MNFSQVLNCSKTRRYLRRNMCPCAVSLRPWTFVKHGRSSQIPVRCTAVCCQKYLVCCQARPTDLNIWSVGPIGKSGLSNLQRRLFRLKSSPAQTRPHGERWLVETIFGTLLQDANMLVQIGDFLGRGVDRDTKTESMMLLDIWI